MSRELTTTTSSASPESPPRPRGEGIPLGKLLDPLRWYFKWVRANPESATSLEQFSRTLTMLWSDPTNLITSEAAFALCKLHSFSNFAITSTGGRRTTKTELLTFVLQAVQEVECLMELIYRKYAGHRKAWNALLLLEAVKCTLKACVHRQLFLVPWLWESLKVSMRRALRHLTTLTPRRRVRGGNGSGASSVPSGSFVSGATPAGSGGAVQMDYGGAAGAGGSLRGRVVGPNNTRLVIPRVASDRRHEHRHVYLPGISGGDGAGFDDGEDHITFAHHHNDDDADAAELEEAEVIGFTWIDLLGMMLDTYLLLRPLALVAVARQAHLALPEAEAGTIGVLPPPVSKAELAAAAKAVEEAAAEAKRTGMPAKPTPPGPDPFAALHKAMSATPQQTLLGNWRVWAAVTGCDLLVAALARLVRHHRVPVVYIKENASDVDAVCGPSAAAPLEGGETAALPGSADGDEDGAGAAAAAAAVTNPAANAGAIGESVMELPVVSRDRMRVQQAVRNIFYNFLRDPFFTAVLKQFVFQHFIRGFVNRIPLLGPCITFYVSHYLSMQYYSFLYTLGQ